MKIEDMPTFIVSIEATRERRAEILAAIEDHAKPRGYSLRVFHENLDNACACIASLLRGSELAFIYPNCDGSAFEEFRFVRPKVNSLQWKIGDTDYSELLRGIDYSHIPLELLKHPINMEEVEQIAETMSQKYRLSPNFVKFLTLRGDYNRFLVDDIPNADQGPFPSVMMASVAIPPLDLDAPEVTDTWKRTSVAQEAARQFAEKHLEDYLKTAFRETDWRGNPGAPWWWDDVDEQWYRVLKIVEPMMPMSVPGYLLCDKNGVVTEIKLDVVYVFHSAIGVDGERPVGSPRKGKS